MDASPFPLLRHRSPVCQKNLHNAFLKFLRTEAAANFSSSQKREHYPAMENTSWATTFMQSVEIVATLSVNYRLSRQ